MHMCSTAGEMSQQLSADSSGIAVQVPDLKGSSSLQQAKHAKVLLRSLSQTKLELKKASPEGAARGPFPAALG